MATLDTTPIDNLSDEVEVLRKQVADVLEGFEDYLSLDLRPESKAQIEELRKRYTTRLNKQIAVIRALSEANGAIQILVADGYPAEPGGVVDKEVIEDMDANLDTLIAARARFSPRPITTKGALVVGEEKAA